MRNLRAFIWGWVIAILGGLIGLGGAEFRLPVLVGIFRYRTLQAIVMNLIISLVTVVFSFIFRTGLTGFNITTLHAGIILNILAGSLCGAYVGVNFATRLDERRLTCIVVTFLLLLSFIIISHGIIAELTFPRLPSALRTLTGFLAGVVIGIFSSVLGVAGGELIIPTIVLIFAVDIKIAGTLSLAISIPTIIMGLIKYHRRHQLSEISAYQRFIAWMAAGSIFGSLMGSYLLKFVSSPFLHILLGIILFISALRLLSH